MKITILTMFPAFFSSFLKMPVIDRAIKKGSVTIELVDIKEYAGGSFRHIDDSPYGGGPGMLLRVDVLHRALEAALTTSGVSDGQVKRSHVVLLSPKGGTFNQGKARNFSKLEDLILICGHYEGYDSRIEKYVDEQVSLGDFILTGGELVAMTITDSIVRLLKGSLRETSTETESFETGLLEYPQYTHPVEYNGDKVPEVLLSGNQRAIEQWKMVHSIIETIKFRPEMLNQDIVCSKSVCPKSVCPKSIYPKSVFPKSVCPDATELTIGESGARILQFDDLILKIEEQSGQAQREYEALNWLKGRIPVPSLYGHEIKDNKSYILMSKVKGRMLCDPTILSNRRRLLKSAVAALRTLWTVDITDCPKSWIEGDSNTCDLVLSHGDLCLPNVLVSCQGIEGFIDLGRVKVASKWRDIATILKSLTDNLVGCYAQADYGPFEAQEFFELLEIEPDEEKLSYYLHNCED